MVSFIVVVFRILCCCHLDWPIRTVAASQREWCSRRLLDSAASKTADGSAGSAGSSGSGGSSGSAGFSGSGRTDPLVNVYTFVSAQNRRGEKSVPLFQHYVKISADTVKLSEQGDACGTISQQRAHRHYPTLYPSTCNRTLSDR